MNQPETARALLYRHGLPEDVIDGALCLHAQELAAVQRADAQARYDRSYSDNRIFELKGARNAADLIDPTKGAVSSAGQAPATTTPSRRAGLREVVIDALDNAHHTHPCPELGDKTWSGCVHYDDAGRMLGVGVCHSERRADAVLAVLPAPTDHAAVLREQAERLSTKANKLTENLQDLAYFVAKDRLREAEILDREAAELRRLADETPDTQTQAHEPLHQWRVEILDGDEWMPASGLRRDRAQVVEQLRMSSEKRPLWNDGTPVQRRLVRETTTYTVESPAADARLCECGCGQPGELVHGRRLATPEPAAGARQDGATS